MSQARFTLLVVAIGVVVAVGSFVAALALLSDDDGGDPVATDGRDTDGGGGTSTTADLTIEPAALETPAWVAIVASGGDRDAIEQVADRAAATGRSAGLLESSDYTSLAPNLWVAYVGPFADSAAADAELAALADEGFSGAYTRCVGTAEQCTG